MKALKNSVRQTILILSLQWIFCHGHHYRAPPSRKSLELFGPDISRGDPVSVYELHRPQGRHHYNRVRPNLHQLQGRRIRVHPRSDYPSPSRYFFCYDQMFQNGYFKEIGGSLSLWYGEDVHLNANSVQAVKFRESHVVIVTYRRNVFSCIKQNIARAIPCLSGSGFYLRVMADVLMVDPWNYLFFVLPFTFPPSRYTKTWLLLNCLFINIITCKYGNHSDVVEAYDTNI